VWTHNLTPHQIEHFSLQYCAPIGSGAPATYRWTTEEVVQWRNNPLVNPKTGRLIKPSKTGVYADLKKAEKLYGFGQIQSYKT
jgi:hypothetical protein